MTPQEQYKIDLAEWSEDIAIWQKSQKAWVESVIKLSKNPMPNPGPAPKPPIPPPDDKTKLKDLLGTGTKPSKPVNPPSSGMPRSI